MNWSFIVGLTVGINLAGTVYWFVLQGVRRDAAASRAEQIRRLDEISDWSRRQYEQARKEIGLPPRSVS